MARVHLPVIEEDARGSGRKGQKLNHPRAHSVSVKELKRSEVLQFRTRAYDRPKTRADCVEGIRPCPYVGCRFNLYLDVNERNGSIKFRFPDLEPEDMAVSCALDVADNGGATMYQVGALMNMTKQGVEQIEGEALKKLRKVVERNRVLRDYRHFTPLSDVASEHALSRIEEEG